MSVLQHQAIYSVTKGILDDRVAGPFEQPTLHTLSPVISQYGTKKRGEHTDSFTT